MTSKAQNIEIQDESLENHLGYQLRRVAVLLQADLTAALKELQLIPTAAAIMLVLANKENIIQVELARMLGLQRTNISPLIVSLEKRGFLSRSNLDGRSQSVQLTAQGLAKIQGIQVQLDRHSKDCFAQLSRAEILNLEEVVKSTQGVLDQKQKNSDDMGVGEQFSYQLLRTSSLAMSKLVKALAPLKLIPGNASAMLTIANNPGVIQSELGRSLGIKRANISTLISELKERKLVSVKSEGRAQLLYLSEAGQVLIKQIEHTFDCHETNCFSHLDEVKIKEAVNSLYSIRQRLVKNKQLRRAGQK
ncbi:MAG: hypothetical protein COA71_13095 [SAR86 cluster bacterium]|uniref:HTH marR-type domain-containing protein n=1 Tax=SAR86 cluster bacterium TaxID=2030880 RepID=A0A2A5C7N4_9GAMM|nr:MAG: hypothetical protein COA71_13095 [SAR86 cluster bacterium]